MKVRIYGPNLNDQSKGSFHVHAADCADCKKYGPRGRLGGEVLPVQNVNSEMDAVRYVYEDIIAEGSSEESCYEDFHFAPCVKTLPKDAH